MKQIHRAIISVIVILMLATTIVYATKENSKQTTKFQKLSEQLTGSKDSVTNDVYEGNFGMWTVGGTKNLFVNVCCIDSEYILMTVNGQQTYLTIPVKIDVWDSSMTVVNGANVDIEIYYQSEPPYAPIYTKETKITNSDGEAKFGITIPFNRAHIYYAGITVTKGTEHRTFWKIFKVWNQNIGIS